eukprot:CAMPEP_0204515674 /NCGR_PEP_ID=MMETSP0661-20131031/2747_1 /ASSEMBLY_ACC=CAM_ASM_000606 /TAXON_ID=109239 /ORGANISM="Alexandrium margalefi, Strain AMGDE01CS-322" /LENGTH=122 /DNA_ID=CAMNT_0051521003 /DNA_START=168 /DNA_END=536 /DNA_ORIENTATION=+
MKWHGRFLPDPQRAKPLKVGSAKVQGLKESLELLGLLKLEALERDGSLPITFVGSKQVDPIAFLRQLMKNGEQDAPGRAHEPGAPAAASDAAPALSQAGQAFPRPTPPDAKDMPLPMVMFLV